MNDDTIMALAYSLIAFKEKDNTIPFWEDFRRRNKKTMEETLRKQFDYKPLINPENQKYEIKKLGYKWEDVRKYIIDFNNGQCAVSGISVNKWMGVYFYDFEYAKQVMTDFAEQDNHNEFYNYSPNSFAVCLCEAAYYGLMAFTLFKNEWFSPLVTFRYSDTWTQEHITRASLNGNVNKAYVRNKIYKIGLIYLNELPRADGESIMNTPDNLNLWGQCGFDIDDVEEINDNWIVNCSAQIKDDIKLGTTMQTIIVYNIETESAYLIRNWKTVFKGVRVLFTKKYEIYKRNKESLSKKLINKRGK